LKSNLCHTADIAKTVAISVRIVLGEFNLDGDAARCRMGNLRDEQSIVCACC
jgi:hypothetical protein